MQGVTRYTRPVSFRRSTILCLLTAMIVASSAGPISARPTVDPSFAVVFSGGPISAFGKYSDGYGIGVHAGGGFGFRIAKKDSFSLGLLARLDWNHFPIEHNSFGDDHASLTVELKMLSLRGKYMRWYGLAGIGCRGLSSMSSIGAGVHILGLSGEGIGVFTEIRVMPAELGTIRLDLGIQLGG